MRVCIPAQFFNCSVFELISVAGVYSIYIEFLLNIKYMLCIVFNILPLTGRHAREFDGVSILCVSVINSFVNAHTPDERICTISTCRPVHIVFLVSLMCNVVSLVCCVWLVFTSRAHDLKCVIADRLLE